jgi:hypothetical protein
MRLKPTGSLGAALSDAHHSIADLAGETRRLGERHRPDHDVHHLTSTLGRLLDAAAATLARGGDRYDQRLSMPTPDADRSGGSLAPAREKLADALGGRPIAGALLLADLRRLLGVAADASIACIILAQGAQATGDRDLLEAVTAAHATVLRVHRWALTRLKTTAPQVLTS